MPQLHGLQMDFGGLELPEGWNKASSWRVHGFLIIEEVKATRKSSA